MMAKINDKEVFFDREDLFTVMEYPWRITKTGYVRSIRVLPGGKAISWLLHRLITGASEGDLVDHVNGNGLDNRRSNLRLCDSAQNSWNTRSRKTNVSGYKGVTPVKGKWLAQIRCRGTNYRIGLFNDPESAHNAYCDMATKLHGDFAYMPTPEKERAERISMETKWVRCEDHGRKPVVSFDCQCAEKASYLAPDGKMVCGKHRAVRIRVRNKYIELGQEVPSYLDGDFILLDRNGNPTGIIASKKGKRENRKW